MTKQTDARYEQEWSLGPTAEDKFLRDGDEHQAERKRIQESGETLNYTSAGATWRKRKTD